MAKRERILLCKPKMCGREIDFIRAALAEDWAVPLGPDCDAFERELEAFVAPPQPSPQGRETRVPLLPFSAGEGEDRHRLADPLNYNLLKENAKRMRRNPTEAESVMWEILRNNQLGTKFRRQHVVGNYIADFADLSSGLVVEIDGGYHANPEQIAADEERTSFLQSKGFRVIRFTNEQVLYNPDTVLTEIKASLTHNPDTVLTKNSDSQALPPAGGAGGGLRVASLMSGTAAVHLALIACGVKTGDEVIVQTFTFCASSHPVTYLGATPVFVDSEPESWNMDPELLEVAIKDRIEKTGRKPKAIVPVALYGMPYRIDRIMEVANRYEIPVIEDAAEGFGSRFNGQVLGTFGRYGVLSFNGNKMITTSGGGALICPDEEAWRKVMWYATQARESYPYYQHEEIGYNYRMSNICAGIGRGQMTVLDEHIAHHKRVQALYEELLRDVEGITMHGNPWPESDSNFWLCTAVLNEELRIKNQEQAYKQVVTGAVGGAAGVIHVASATTTDCQPNDNVEALRMALDKAGIESRPLWKPMHHQPVYRNNPAYVNGVSESLFATGICLPAGPWVGDEEVHYIVENIKNAIQR